MWSGSNSLGQTKRSDRFPQGGAHIGIGEKRLAPIGVNGEKIAATRHMGAAIISHDGIIKSMNGAGTRPTCSLPYAPSSTSHLANRGGVQIYACSVAGAAERRRLGIGVA